MRRRPRLLSAALRLFALAVVALLALGARDAYLNNRPSSGTHVPQLDGKEIIGWLGTNRVVARSYDPRSYGDVSGERVWVTDLSSGAVRQLSDPSSSYARPDDTDYSDRTFDFGHTYGPYPSPDGNWLLYRECLERSRWIDGPDEVRDIVRSRWRLVRADGKETRLFPSSGAYIADQSKTHGEKTRFDVVWLPDSRGWLLASLRSRPKSDRRLLTIEKSDHQLLTIERFSLDRRDGASVPIAIPANASQLLGMTSDERLVFRLYDKSDADMIQFVDSRPGAAFQRPVALHTRQTVDTICGGADRTGNQWLYLSSGNTTTGFTGLPEITPDGHDQIVSLLSPPNDPLHRLFRMKWLANWNNSLKLSQKPSWQLWLAPIDGKAPRPLVVFHESDDLENIRAHSRICVSPDGRQLLYSAHGKTYLLPIR